MVRPKLLIGIGLLASAAGLILSLNGCGGSSFTHITPPTGKIEHVVILFQENRTPDNLFQDPVLIAKGADIATSGVNSKGNTIQLTPINLGTTGARPQNYDLSHAHVASPGCTVQWYQPVALLVGTVELNRLGLGDVDGSAITRRDR